MKKICNQLLVAISLVLLMSGMASAVTLTFDDLGLAYGDTFVGNEYASYGVNFSTPDLRLGIGTTTGSQPNSMGADESSLSDFDGTIQIDFTAGFFVTDLMFTIFNTPFSASAYDFGGALLTTITGGADFTQLFDFSGFEVNSVTISGDFYAIDDVTFGELTSAAPVPEPSTILLLGSGLLGLAWYGRKRKKA